MRTVLLALAAMAIAGCSAPAPSSLPPSDYAAALGYSTDQTVKIRTIKAGDIKNGQSSIHLRAARSIARPDIEPKIAIYASLFYSGDWRFYDAALTGDGKSWTTQSVRRDVLGCNRNRCEHGELLLIDIPSDYLREKVSSGIDLKIRGRAGEEAFFISPAYISAFLAGVYNDPRAFR